MYIELCNNCTMVLKYHENNDADVQLYRHGVSVDRKELSEKDLYMVDIILEDYKENCHEST
jgi:hypothetical protein